MWVALFEMLSRVSDAAHMIPICASVWLWQLCLPRRNHIICGPAQLDLADSKGETVTNPRVVVEVISPSTESYDRKTKFDGYRRVESFEEYVLVSQDVPRIETFRRQADGSWAFMVFTGLGEVAKVQSVQIDLPLAEAYDGVDFRRRHLWCLRLHHDHTSHQGPSDLHAIAREAAGRLYYWRTQAIEAEGVFFPLFLSGVQLQSLYHCSRPMSFASRPRGQGSRFLWRRAMCSARSP